MSEPFDSRSPGDTSSERWLLIARIACFVIIAGAIGYGWLRIIRAPHNNFDLHYIVATRLNSGELLYTDGVLLSIRFLLRDGRKPYVNTTLVLLAWLAVSAWTKGRDGLGGLSLGFAVALKKTAALFIPYFVLKRQWTMVRYLMDRPASHAGRAPVFLPDGTRAEGQSHPG